MSRMDQEAVAYNAAGITDAFRVVQWGDDDGSARLEDLCQEHGGWVGVLGQFVEAARVMEEFRTRKHRSARWGAELPYLYEVWDAIAESLWHQLGSADLRSLVENAIDEAVVANAAGNQAS